MSDGFLGRWSRRKLATRNAHAVPSPDAGPDARPAEPEIELPPLDTLGPSSDYTLFLQQAVSAKVQQQALRRAWESDVTIAGFRGMADYDWDFNAPSYGRLWASDDVAQLVREVLTAPEPEPAAEPIDEPEPAAPVMAETEPLAITGEAAVPSDTEESALSDRPRRHGSALPC